jgi:UDP-N-acetylglucosamine 2-epimerase (non-hydrolysing)
MAPVVAALQEQLVDSVVISSGQHREMLKDATESVGLEIDANLNIMQAGQTPFDVVGRTMAALRPLLEQSRFDLLVVHGDTSTTAGAAIAAFSMGVPVAHVEAGLRTGDLESPWPEEGNRRLVDSLSHLRFAPTQMALETLRREGLTTGSWLTGNTVVDALRSRWSEVTGPSGLELVSQLLGPLLGRGYVLATQHRRESFGSPLLQVFSALRELAESGVAVVMPVHRNGVVSEAANSVLGGVDNILLLDPLPYDDFLRLLAFSSVVVTDSGGVQEEGPSFGVPVVVTRPVTERPEGVAAGLATLCGYNANAIVSAVRASFSGARTPPKTPLANPYGDGHAGHRIAGLLMNEWRARGHFRQS